MQFSLAARQVNSGSLWRSASGSRSERETLVTERAAVKDKEIDLTIHPAVTKSYLSSLDNLEAALRGPEGALESEEFAAIRNLVDQITVTPGGEN